MEHRLAAVSKLETPAMFWQEDDTEKTFEVPDDIVDILFSVDCRHVPVDHAYALSAALHLAAPWIAEESSGVAVHSIHVAGSQNGWERPEHGTSQHLILSKRTKLCLRVPRERMDALLEDLQGKTLDGSGSPLTIGAGKIRPLSKERTLFSLYLVAPPIDREENPRQDPQAPTGASSAELQPDDSEEGFLAWAVQALADQGIQVRKALCGKATPLGIPGGILRTRSLLVADLTAEESVRLQQQGLGPHRKMGCGIFIPHKGIEAVG